METRKEFLLSKGNLFVLFKSLKIILFGYLFFIIVFFVELMQDGISKDSLIQFFMDLIVVSIWGGGLYFLFKFVLAWKNHPYKLTIDLEKRCIDFKLSHTKEVRSIPFDEIDYVLDRVSKLRFALKDGTRFIWHMEFNMKEKDLLDMYIMQTNIEIKHGSSII